MKLIEKTPDLLSRLQAFELFHGINETALQWLINCSRYTYYEEGELMFHPGTPTDYMLVFVQGVCFLELEQNDARLMKLF